MIKENIKNDGFVVKVGRAKQFNPSEKIIHDQFVLYGRNAKEWLRKCVFLLPEIERTLIWQKKGFSDIYDYSRTFAGMSRPTVDDSLRILAKIEDKPAIKKVAEEKGLGLIRPILTLVTNDNQDFWAEKIRQMSKHALEAFVQEYKKLRILNDENGSKEEFSEINLISVEEFGLTQNKIDKNQGGLFEARNECNFRPGPEIPNTQDLPSDVKSAALSMGKSLSETANSTNIVCSKKILGMDLNPQTIERLEKLKGTGSWDDLMNQFLEMRERQLQAQKPEPATAENPGNCQKLSRYVSARIINYLIEKYNGLCAFPHCRQPYQIIHHTQRWALKHEHDPDKMVLLCKGHERLFHLGLIENEEGDSTEWKIRFEAEKNDPKYEIDRKVQEFRSFGQLSF